MELTIVKRDGSRESYDGNNIYRALEKASRGLDDQITKVVQIATEVRLTLFDGMHYLTKILLWIAKVISLTRSFSPSNHQESDGNDLALPVRYL